MDQLIGGSINETIDWLIDWFIDWLNDWVIDLFVKIFISYNWLIDWMIIILPEPTKTPSTPSCIRRLTSAGVAEKKRKLNYTVAK